MSLKTKTPKISGSPTESKIPKMGGFPNENKHLEFRADQMDIDGLWGWEGISALKLKEIFSKIFACQKLTWQDLRTKGSHLVDLKDLSSKAQKRLEKIEKDDQDQLYSLRLSGKERIWGIKDGNIFSLLWWDPNHEVCPSLKRHT